MSAFRRIEKFGLSYVHRAVFVLETNTVRYKSTLIMGPTQEINQIMTIWSDRFRPDVLSPQVFDELR